MSGQYLRYLTREEPAVKDEVSRPRPHGVVILELFPKRAMGYALPAQRLILASRSRPASPNRLPEEHEEALRLGNGILWQDVLRRRTRAMFTGVVTCHRLGLLCRGRRPLGQG